MTYTSTGPGRALRAASVALVVGWVGAGTRGHAAPAATEGAGPARIGDAHPALELEMLDGDLITAARVAGKTLIVDFFATWCGPCHNALADLEAARQAAGGNSLLVLVDLGEPADTVRRWREREPPPPDALLALDPVGIAARRWGAHRLPTTFIIDARGIVRHINRGWGTGYRDRLTRWLHDLNAPRPSTTTRTFSDDPVTRKELF